MYCTSDNYKWFINPLGQHPIPYLHKYIGVSPGYYNGTIGVCGDHLTGICTDDIIFKRNERKCLRTAEDFKDIYFNYTNVISSADTYNQVADFCEDPFVIVYALFVRLDEGGVS